MRATTTFACAALLLAAGQAAVLAESGQVRSAKVHFADLNLATDIGEAHFMTRIHEAASDVCGGAPFDHALVGQQIFRSCYNVAMDSAMPQVHEAIDVARRKAHVDINEASNDTGRDSYILMTAPAAALGN